MGRPKGSKNRQLKCENIQDEIKRVVKKYTGIRDYDPLTQMAVFCAHFQNEFQRKVLYSDSYRGLQSSVNIKTFRLVMSCAKELATYMHEKRPRGGVRKYPERRIFEQPKIDDKSMLAKFNRLDITDMEASKVDLK